MTKLYYVHDPMCSWCWGFSNTWEAVEKMLPKNIELQYLLGGLAADTDEPMPLDMRSSIAAIWHQVASVSGAKFNHDFWIKNTPKRSTYPACRAVIVAALSNKEHAMMQAIQHAYYLNAQNPSETETLIQCAESVGLDLVFFTKKLHSKEIQDALTKQIQFARSIGGNHFPSLFLQNENHSNPFAQEIQIEYRNPNAVLDQITAYTTSI